ncbi:hypothetical protein B0T17DRAFT_511265 [Bombardia bombarda]|uniref:Uncharacterized protein n=1 Tax=Bombardia bombarda TaxID=252184 RepID=A0AA39WBR1_9PEZI|nr:hypothetical protein B0T17DRAFT_511265 [Bombardia bombarda]
MALWASVPKLWLSPLSSTGLPQTLLPQDPKTLRACEKLPRVHSNPDLGASGQSINEAQDSDHNKRIAIVVDPKQNVWASGASRHRQQQVENIPKARLPDPAEMQKDRAAQLSAVSTQYTQNRFPSASLLIRWVFTVDFRNTTLGPAALHPDPPHSPVPKCGGWVHQLLDRSRDPLPVTTSTDSRRPNRGCCILANPTNQAELLMLMMILILSLSLRFRDYMVFDCSYQTNHSMRRTSGAADPISLGPVLRPSGAQTYISCCELSPMVSRYPTGYHSRLIRISLADNTKGRDAEVLEAQSVTWQDP